MLPLDKIHKLIQTAKNIEVATLLGPLWQPLGSMERDQTVKAKVVLIQPGQKEILPQFMQGCLDIHASTRHAFMVL